MNVRRTQEPSDVQFRHPLSLVLIKLGLFVVLCAVLTMSCEKNPLFNLIGLDENPSRDLVINPILHFYEIKRIGSVYGTPGAGAGGTPHNGIDIGTDEGVAFRAGCSGVVTNIAESHDNYSSVTDVEVQYNEELSVCYLFEPPQEIVVKEGDLVGEGDIIGYLGAREAGFIDQCVHFWMKIKGEAVCPVPYLREDFRKKLNEVYRSRGPVDPPNICACPEHQFYFR